MRTSGRSSVVGSRSRAAALAAFALALLAPGAASAAEAVRAGVGVVDATWHVGASAGQYSGDCTDSTGRCTFVGDHGVDPTTHSTRRAASYGIQSRLSARAIVVEGPDGERVAIVKNDLYIPQDLLFRRTAQILEAGDSGIGRENLTMAVSHNHSSPFYSSTSWGAWAFQDVFDVRFYEYYAQRMARAVEKAAKGLVPVRVGASVSQFDKTHRHSFGGAVADDGTPAGYPVDDTDHDMTVIRFDDVSDPRRPRPLANLVNFGLHPEFLSGNDLLSGDYIAPLERMVDRATGAVTIFTQNAVGTSEPERSTYHSIHERLEFSHREYAQAEYGARLMADSIIGTWRDVERRTPADPDRFVPFATDFPVAMEDRWFPGPISHPYPGVSSCRTDSALGGDPRAPVAGLPDCEGTGGTRNLGIDPGLSTDDLERAGIPVPENYSAPGYTGLEEDVSVHLQAIRLGEILLTICSCEQWKDQSLNIKTRTDRVAGNEYLGYDWSARCTDNGNGTWTCPDPRNPAATLPPVSDAKLARMRAQVRNPANGWNDLDYAPWAESEPADPAAIKGNFTHDDDERSADLGYRLTVTVSMANDYNGYIASYREYQRGDHYRKALTGWGPHSSDYMATRLVQMGRHLNGGPDLAAEPGQQKVTADLAFNDRRAHALGTAGGGAIAAYEATLPDDGGAAEAIRQPRDVERFAAAFFTWNGGSNFTDDPVVVVQRRRGDRWQDYADQSGEVPVTLRFPQGEEMQSWATGSHRWEWTAHFEAFVAPFDTGDRPRATPPGRYRFVVHGHRRDGRRAVPYEVISDEFRVRPWRGITVEDVRAEPDGSVSYLVGPRRVIDVTSGGPSVRAEIGPIDYPDSYDSPARFIQERRTPFRDPQAPGDPARIEWFCFTCSFRPWLDAGDAVRGAVTVVAADGAARTVPAERRGDRWVADARLRPGESAYVEAGAVEDAFGDVNGARSASVTA